MQEKKEYFKLSRKAPKPISIRYNQEQFNKAAEISGKPTIQGLFDYLLDLYVTNNGALVANNVQNAAPQIVLSDSQPKKVAVEPPAPKKVEKEKDKPVEQPKSNKSGYDRLAIKLGK